MPAYDRVSGPAQVLRQIHFHLRRRFKGHRVQMLAQFRQRADAVAFHHRGRFGSCLVVGEAFLWGQPSHSHVQAGLLGVAFRVGSTNAAESACGAVEQDHVDVVMVFRLSTGAESLEGPAFHLVAVGQPESHRESLPHPEELLSVGNSIGDGVPPVDNQWSG